jgi:DNA-binding IclR family transcriptional regulator
MRVGTLAESFNRQLAPDEALQASVRRVVDLTGEAAYLVARQGTDVVLLTAVSARHAVSVTLPPLGVLSHAHARASGKVALAFAPEHVRSEYLRTHDFTPLTPNTTVDPEQIQSEWAQVRREGFAMNIEELAIGMCAIAAPLDGGMSPFAISMSAPRDRFDANRDRYLRAVLQVSNEASSRAYDLREPNQPEG